MGQRVFGGRAAPRRPADVSWDRLLATLGRCEVAVLAISSVDIAAREGKGRWTLRLRERAELLRRL